MKSKHTKRALLSSVLALVLCFSMMLGTTFAWFTDEVTSANNIIQSGNLDIELEYAVFNDDGTFKEWKDVKEASDILSEDLWEPGYVDTAYLRLKNAGSLALKYQLGVNIVSETEGTNKAGAPFKLSDYIYFDVAEGVNGETGAYATRADALAVATQNTKISAGYSKSGELLANADYVYLAMVLHMPTTVDNDANHNGTNVPQIDLGIKVFATQLEAEMDSFGSDYDAAAPWTGSIPEFLEDTNLEIVPGGGTQTGTITVNSAEDLVYLTKLAQEWVSLYSNGQGTDVTYYREINGGKGTDYYYHWEWEVVLDADLDMSNIPMDSIGIAYWASFNGNGHTISNIVLKDGEMGLFENTAKPDNRVGAISNLNIKNIVVNAPDAKAGAIAHYTGALTNVHVENATISGGKYVGGLAGKAASITNCSVKNSTVTGTEKTVGGLVGYSIGDPDAATVTGNTVENVTVTGAYNVGGLLGQAQNETVESNTVKNVTVISTTELPADASSNEVRAAKVAARSGFDTTTVGSNTVENVTIIEVANVATADDLKAALEAGETDIAVKGATFTENFFNGRYYKDRNIDFVDCTFTANMNYMYINDATYTNCTFDCGSANAAVHYDELFGDLVFNNCTFTSGKVQIGANADVTGTVTFNSCTFAETTQTSIWSEKGIRVYSPAKFNNCEFNNRVVMAGANGLSITFNSCTMNGGEPVYYVDNDNGIIRGGNIPAVTIN